MKEIDARGLSCPAPVLKTKAALESEPVTGITVLVDNPAARENLLRFLSSQGFDTATEQQGNDFRITGTRASAAAAPSPEKHREHGKIMVLCATDRIGFGDDTLGQKLMINFLRTLKEMGDDLWRLVFVNNGVKLTIDGSAVLDDLKAYEAAGLKILVCGTCLDHFKLLDKKKVGETTNMLDIVTALQLADKVISL
jgi:selenium metabolism protein YedF